MYGSLFPPTDLQSIKAVARYHLRPGHSSCPQESTTMTLVVASLLALLIVAILLLALALLSRPLRCCPRTCKLDGMFSFKARKQWAPLFGEETIAITDATDSSATRNIRSPVPWGIGDITYNTSRGVGRVNERVEEEHGNGFSMDGYRHGTITRRGHL
ncbi:hypothetical protein BKA70DRAFT_643201 [Coprinopsis sp. MPI-PUGE-AT-0042]|nr:hypothetical protein BKA70DRAFT_643201 [Coprinopsis sp. MPI-PUGE-AT-0042]